MGRSMGVYTKNYNITETQSSYMPGLWGYVQV